MVSGNIEFGKRVKQLREMQNFSQEQLAELIGVEYQTISRIETGMYFTGYENLKKIAHALNVEIKDLFNFSEKYDRTELYNKITDLLDKTSAGELEFFYKLINDFMELKYK